MVKTFNSWQPGLHRVDYNRPPLIQCLTCRTVSHHFLLLLHKLYGVTKAFSAAYHCRGHGMVECLHRTIEDRLKYSTNFGCNDWDQWLPEALFAIRTTPSDGTKFSPSRLLYGRDAIMPIDNALIDLTTANTDRIENKKGLSYGQRPRHRQSEYDCIPCMYTNTFKRHS
jgi:hypothetical protein